jgi:hypothetical protein
MRLPQHEHSVHVVADILRRFFYIADQDAGGYTIAIANNHKIISQKILNSDYYCTTGYKLRAKFESGALGTCEQGAGRM